jgi:predicted GNAT family N-acyltransferase
MRKPHSNQKRFDCHPVNQVQLNLNCRDEIIPVLRSLQHIYSVPTLRQEILGLVASDVNHDSRHDRGREGLDYWQVLVLAGVRLGCDLDYDKLQDLAEQHRALRHIMGIGDWQEHIDFNWRRIRDNVCLLQSATIEKICHALVAEGHALAPDAAKRIRVDSFVMETNIHYPTESSLIDDGVRKVIELSVDLADELNLSGWRQHQHLLKNIAQITREIGRIAARKGANYKQRMEKQYRRLLKQTGRILRRAQDLCEQALALPAAELDVAVQTSNIKHFMDLTQQVCNTARRRVLQGETVPNEDKLFSIFEPHTQLYKRGKAGEPVQFGRLLLVYEDAAGFIVHQHLMDRAAQDVEVAVEQTRELQLRLQSHIEEISFDCGFHSPENQTELAKIVPLVCLPKKGKHQSAEQNASATKAFRRARRRHSGVEAAIGVLQAGNGLKRCRDKTESGFERYLALGVFGRNLHTLGKLLIAREDESANAAYSKRQAA